MKSYTTGRNLYGSQTKNTSAANLTYGDQIANDDYRHLCSLKDWPFLERNRTLTTVANTQFYNLPYDCDIVRSINVVVSATTYVPKLSPSREHWDQLNLSTFTGDIPEWYFVFAGQLGIWPKPATSSNTINVFQKSRVIDLSAADYTTGTITTIANGGTVVTGSGTTWTNQMVGRYIRITMVDTANTGDGQWYEISAVSSATSLTLVRAYGGNAISVGTASYIIGQMPLLPESFQDLPWIWAAGTYWQKEDNDRADSFFEMHGTPPRGSEPASGRVAELITAWSAPTSNFVIDSGDDAQIINPNLTLSL